MSKKTKDTTVDIDYADQAVPKEGRKGFLTMFMIMLGFTFFSASMWVGQQMAAGLDFWGFIKSLLLGGAILGVYTGLLGYVGAKTGLSMDLLAKRAFGTSLRSDGSVWVLRCLQSRYQENFSVEVRLRCGLWYWLQEAV